MTAVIRRPEDDFTDQADALAAHTGQINVEGLHAAPLLPFLPAGVMAWVGQVWMQEPSPMQRSVLMVTLPSVSRVKVGQPNVSIQVWIRSHTPGRSSHAFAESWDLFFARG
jgi:hypothetical protein